MEDPTALFHQYEAEYCNKSTDISRKINACTGLSGGGLRCRMRARARALLARRQRSCSSGACSPAAGRCIACSARQPAQHACEAHGALCWQCQLRLPCFFREVLFHMMANLPPPAALLNGRCPWLRALVLHRAAAQEGVRGGVGHQGGRCCGGWRQRQPAAPQPATAAACLPCPLL